MVSLCGLMAKEMFSNKIGFDFYKLNSKVLNGIPTRDLHCSMKIDLKF